MKIYIVRHGETDLNKQGARTGWGDVPLNDNGRKLAVLTGQEMKRMGLHFDGCFSSSLGRAVETAEILLRESGNEGVPIVIDDRLKEINFGELEGTGGVDDEENRRFAIEFGKNPFGVERFPGGECVEDVMQRTQEFLKELLARDDGKTYLIAAHGCALRAMLNFLYEDPGNYWHGHVPYNCCVNIVEGHGGEGRLVGDDLIYYDPKYVVDLYKHD